jgi:hypothetical protein
VGDDHVRDEPARRVDRLQAVLVDVDDEVRRRERREPREVEVLGAADLRHRLHHGARMHAESGARDHALAQAQREEELGHARHHARDARRRRRRRVTPAQSVRGLTAAACLARRARERGVVQRVGHQAQRVPDERHRPGQHVVALAAPDRPRDQPGGAVGGNEERHRVAVPGSHRRGDVPRRDGDHRHAAAGELDAQALEVGDRGGLRRRVRARAGQAAKPGHAGDADQRSVAPLAHRGAGGTWTMPSTLVSRTAEDRQVLRSRSTPRARSGVSDHDVQDAKRAPKSRRRQRRGVAHVACVGARLPGSGQRVEASRRRANSPTRAPSAAYAARARRRCRSRAGQEDVRISAVRPAP